MHKTHLFFLIFITLSTVNAQNSYPTSGKALVSGLDVGINRNAIASNVGLNLGHTPYTNINITHDTWSGSHGILFNAYQADPNPSGGLDVYGNTKFSNDVGAYNSGAGAIMYYGNGGTMKFYVTPASSGKDSLVSWGTPQMTIKRSGNVGIGISDPESSFHVASDGTAFQITPISSNADVSQSIIAFNTNNDAPTSDVDAVLNLVGAQSGSFNHKRVSLKALGTTGGNREGILVIEAREQSSGDNVEVARFQGDGNVGIGTSNPDQKLTVKGKIHSEEVIVDLNVPGPDYVFEEDYNLTSLKELEAYIKANKHLPEIPSAKEMEANGITLGEMNVLLLKKIEELTLHAIAQEKTLNEKHKMLEEEKEHNNTQQRTIEMLIKRIEKLEAKGKQ
ncbi:MAG: hypothetical protein ACMZ7B_01650 [Balneola sp.]